MVQRLGLLIIKTITLIKIWGLTELPLSLLKEILLVIERPPSMFLKFNYLPPTQHEMSVLRMNFGGQTLFMSQAWKGEHSVGKGFKL